MPLRFDELSPREFEELCLWLLRAEGHTETRHTGAAGRDFGWDLRTRDPQGRICCVQCKRKPAIGPPEAVRELGKAWKYREERPFDVWMLMASADLGATTEQKLAEVGAECRIELVGKSDLEARLAEHPRVRDRFFAGDGAKAQIAYLSACKADRDLASKLRGDLQLALRAHVGQGWSVRWHDPTDDRHALPEVPDAASWGLVLVSPEALADRQLQATWQGALSAGHEMGRRSLLAVSLAETAPWPAWLEERFERLELRPESYRIDLSKIISKWIGTTEKNFADALDLDTFDGELPSPPRLDPALYRRLAEWLAPVMESPMARRYLAASLSLDGMKALDGFPSAALQASAAVVLSRQDDEPARAALRLIGVVHDQMKHDESAGRLAELDRLAGELRAAETPEVVDRGLLPSWLRKVRDDHERLVDYFQRRHELDLLDRVYVELEMSPDRILAEGREMAEKGRTLLDRSLGIEQVLALDPEEHEWVTRRWVVRGDPGSGKTTLLRHLAARLAARDSGRWVPVFQSLPVLMRSGRELLDRLERQMASQTGRAGLAAVLDREGQEGRLLLLLDGLDEVGDRRDEAEALLRRLAERWPETPIIVSTRPIGYRRFSPDFRELQLLPLDEKRRFEFLASWFGRADGVRDEKKAREAMRQLGGAGFDELAGNPLYLTLMALLLEQGTAPEHNRSALYDQVFKLLLEGRHKHPEPDPIDRPKLVRRALRLLAYTMTLDNLDAEEKAALEERLYLPELLAIREQIKQVARWDGPMRLFLDDLASKVGILGPHDGEDAEWKFWHRTFKEALTAEHLSALPEEQLLEQAAGLAGEESRWAEPYALVTGQVDEPDALLRQLVGLNRALGLRALATAQGVSDATLDEILELTDDLEERSKVLEALPATVGDAERALKLIDRLRRRTRDGFDLFWLHRAAELVIEEDGDFQEPVRELHQRFFDHIPAPDPELFQTFRTAAGEERPLWCEIPAETYWVGSPENKGGRDEDEVRHQVEVERAYRIAAIPVTNRQYAAFDPELAPYRFDGVSQEELWDHPRVEVSWYDAVSFCRWLGALDGFHGVRLPSDPEWEIACRARTQTAYWSGDTKEDLDRVGWFNENSGSRTHRVAEKERNDFGLYDVHGNVLEWVLDTDDWGAFRARAASVYPVDPAANPEDSAAPPRARRVIRGGCFADSAGRARSASRSWGHPGLRWRVQGFRVLLPPPSGRS